MMEPDTLLELMRTRRSIRRFVDRSVPPGLLEKILEVGRWAPSNHNRQGYRFLVVEDSEELRAIANRVRSSLLEKFHRSARWPDDLIDDFVDHAAWFGAAPCAIVVFHRRPVAVAGALLEDVPGADVVSGEPLSAAMAVQNMILMAHALGLGSCVLTAPLLTDAAETSIFAAPPGFRCTCLVALGYPAETPDPPRRKRMEQLVEFRRKP